jgi:hypothetical protein
MRRAFAFGAAVAAVLLAQGPARAEEIVFGGALPDFGFAALRPLAAPPPVGTAFFIDRAALGAPAAVVPLAPLLDGMASTRAAFRVGNAVVHVYGAKSLNKVGCGVPFHKNDWFVIFKEEGGTSTFRSGCKMLRGGPYNRTAYFKAGGRDMAAFFEGNTFHHKQSRVVVSAVDHSQPDASWSVQELADDAFDTGAPVMLGGREYRLLYTSDFDQDGTGEFARFTGDRSIVLLARDQNGRFTPYHWLESKIPHGDGQVLAVTANPTDDDDENSRPLSVGLSITSDGRLEIYDRSAAVARR